MFKRIALSMLMLVAAVGLLHGQSGQLPPVAPQPEMIPAPTPQPQEIRKKNALLPEDAEAAEAMEANRRPARLWGRAEILIWFLKSPNVPVLVTNGDFSDLPAPGAFGAPGTTVVFGGERINYQDRYGGRFLGGYWLDDDQTLGLEASYFFLTGRTVNRSTDSPGNPVIANPFFNVNTNIQDASLITFPGIASGSVTADTHSFLQGADLNGVAQLWRSDRFRVQLLAGVRWVNLNEDIELNSTSLIQIAPQYQGLGLPYDGNTINVIDRFRVDNHFYGGQLGGRIEFTRKRFTLEMLGKVAIGVSHDVASIRGFTGIDTNPVTAVDAGLYALATNSGRHTSNTFAVVPETGMNLRFQLTENIVLFGGYSFLYWSRVARPADQIDFNVNQNFVPTSNTFGAGGAAAPAFRFRYTDFFAHGANFGFEIRY